jgi:hypothetical protein
MNKNSNITNNDKLGKRKRSPMYTIQDGRVTTPLTGNPAYKLSKQLLIT